MRSVPAAAGSERAAVFGYDFGGRLALLLAATFPEQVPAVVTFATQPTTLRDDDYPWGASAEERRRLRGPVQAATEDPAAIMAVIAPSEAADASALAWWRAYFQ